MKHVQILSTALSICLLSATTGVMAGPQPLGPPLGEMLKGTYAYSFNGEITGGPLPGPVAASGVIDIDWVGDDPSVDPGIDGFEVDAEGERTISIGGQLVCTNTFECDLTVESNEAGNAICITLEVEPEGMGCPEDPETFYFVAEDRGSGFRYVGTTPDTVVLGSGRKQRIRQKN